MNAEIKELPSNITAFMDYCAKENEDVIIECDSQMFHDRTERERRYEKMRDRYLIQQGYKTFHYTGKEITDSPFKVAAEILAYVTKSSVEDILTDSESALGYIKEIFPCNMK